MSTNLSIDGAALPKRASKIAQIDVAGVTKLYIGSCGDDCVIPNFRRGKSGRVAMAGDDQKIINEVVGKFLGETPIAPGSVSLKVDDNIYTDQNMDGKLVDGDENTNCIAFLNYFSGELFWKDDRQSETDWDALSEEEMEHLLLEDEKQDVVLATYVKTNIIRPGAKRAFTVTHSSSDGNTSIFVTSKERTIRVRVEI